MKPIRIGTRGSKLALYQAYHISDLLAKSNLQSEIVIIETKGDRILDVAISKIGSKGVFTEELEIQLAEGAIDIAVHSAKDMQSSLPDGFEIIAFTEREKPNDVIISDSDTIAYRNKNQPLLLGTSSTRRVATLRHYYPHIKTVEVRGNLQTRIAKMESGQCDALLLAYAGVHRMGYDHLIRHVLELDEFTPAVGQGSIAVEASSQMEGELKASITKSVHHTDTGYCLQAERAYLKMLDGGCSIPIFGLATLSGDTLQLNGGIVRLDGSEKISLSVSGEKIDAEAVGRELAHKVIAAGGDEILKEIKSTLNK
ncbi:hydroxymethylbilane synthase [Lunatibacter salilacus]|uniref:hydroxymethylbilane synthase n=1 Tax=Lunatibacter salilacus TaxID=2483804 RepID=UPI00131DE4A7|nr:hydroxymethylbilane synthase [Lunatibacter salilacus]